MTRRVLAPAANVLMGLVLIVVSVYPVVWLLAISFQSNTSAYEVPTHWIFVPHFTNYSNLFSDPNFVNSLLNSIQLGVISTALCVLFGAMAAYAMSRYHVKASAEITFGFAITRLVPSFAIVIPTFYMYQRLHLLDTMVGLICALVAFQLPLTLLIMVRILSGVPRSLDEAARIDGAGFFRIFWQIIMPVARPGLAASAVLTFILIWNEFLFILVLAGNRLITIPLTIATFQTDKQILWGSIAAASMISLIPILIVILFAQRSILSGLGLGAVKE